MEIVDAAENGEYGIGGSVGESKEGRIDMK